MSDLIKRRYVRGSEIELQNALHEATLENERLRGALRKIAETAGPKVSSAKAWAIARGALGEDE
jgi:hypothetical protein